MSDRWDQFLTLLLWWLVGVLIILVWLALLMVYSRLSITTREVMVAGFVTLLAITGPTLLGAAASIIWDVATNP